MKLFAFDVDGTLIDYNQNILSSTIDSVNTILEKGDYMVIASGRPFPGVKKYLDYFKDGKKFAICSNGALVCDNLGHKLYENGLKISDLKKIFNRYHEYINDINIFCFIDGKIGYLKDDKWIHSEARLNNTDILNLLASNYKDDKVIEKVIIAGEKEVIDKIIIYDDLKRDYFVVRSSIFFYDFMHTGIDKSTGVNFLAKYLSIKKSDVYTFGDAENDLLMITNFNGVAMGNAVESVKKVAKFITTDVKEDGIKNAIEKIYKSNDN